MVSAGDASSYSMGVSYILALPEARQLYDAQPPQVVGALRNALTEAFAPYLGVTGVVLDATAWLVTARH